MEKYKVTEINKAKIALYPIKEVRSVMVNVMFKAGSWYEKGDNWGAFHMLEHLLFEGTENLKSHNEIESYKQSYGISNNAWTGGRDIGFWFKFPDLSVNEGLNLMEEIIFKPRIPEDKFSKEISVISQEYKDKWDSPTTRFNYEILGNLIGKNSTYYKDGLGQPDFLNTINRNYLLDLHQTYYQPQNMFISIAGNIDIAEITEKLEKILNRYQNHSIPKPKWNTAKPTTHRLEYQDTVNQSYFVTTWFLGKNTKYDLQTRFGLNIYNYIFGGGPNSILFKKIRQELGLVYNIHSRFYSMHKQYFFEISAPVDLNKLENLEENIKLVMQDFFHQPIDQKLFEQTRHYMDLQTLMAFDSISNIADSLIEDLFYENKVYLPEDRINIVKSIKSENIRKIFVENLDWDKAYISIMKPKSDQRI